MAQPDPTRNTCGVSPLANRPITLIVPTGNMRQWHRQIANRLTASGFAVAITHHDTDPKSHFLDCVAALEARLFLSSDIRLCAPAPTANFTSPQNPKALTLDLTGGSSTSPKVFSLSFSTGNRLCALASAIANGELPQITMHQSGQMIATARPMIDDRIITTRGLEDVLARAVTLAASTLEKHAKGQSQPFPSIVPCKHSNHRFSTTYATRALPRLLREIWRRQRYHYAHWCVGYRFNSSASVSDTNDLSGVDWQVLPDDGTRFYADPFPFAHQGKHYIFVEDYPHKTGKAMISVSEIERDGTAARPVPIIEEDWHLSYPQIFERNGDIWMLPEASGGNALILYRATHFPHKWVRHKTLVADCQLSDATLLEHNNKLWLFATDRDGMGSTSDMMVVYSADNLEGPWVPHPQNPICIDRTKARPGGAFIKAKGKIYLPVQDGTTGYGGGLNIVEIKRLTATQCELGLPQPIAADGHWPYPRIHTYNRADDLEVIDGIAKLKKP